MRIGGKMIHILKSGNYHTEVSGSLWSLWEDSNLLAISMEGRTEVNSNELELNSDSYIGIR